MSNSDGLAQLLSSYDSGESEDSSSENEDIEGRRHDTVQRMGRETSERKNNEASRDSKREILPLPKGVLDMFKEDADLEGDPSKHDGRIRTFSHFPGNWAMHVFIPFRANEHFESLVASIVDSLSASMSCDIHMLPSDELHLSVSRTVPIRHYWIDPMVQQLRNGLGSMHRFVSSLQFPELYANDEKTRSFVALKITSECKKLQHIVDVVDGIFEQFSLPAFYKNPSFHVSVAWLLGDICSDSTEEIQTKLQDMFDALISEKEIARSLILEVKEVHCKIGNKRFVFQLGS